jgi:O-antigen ligase
MRTLGGGIVGLLGLYCALALVSTAWSIYPLWTLYKSAEYLVDVALAAAIVSEIKTVKGIKSLVDLTWVLYGLLLVSVIVGALLWPSQAVAQGVGLISLRLQGVMPLLSANSVGDTAATLFVVAFCRLLLLGHDRFFYWTVLSLAFIVGVLAQSRSPIAAAAMAILVILLCSRRIIPALLILLVSFSFYWYFSDVIVAYLIRGQSPEAVASLTGRVGWWATAFSFIEQKPLLGYGAYAGSRFMVLSSLGLGIVSTLHNAWVEILVNSGVIGSAPVLLAFIGVCLVYARLLVSGMKSRVEMLVLLESAGMLTIEIVRSIFSSGLVLHPSTIFVLTVIFADVYRTRLRTGLAT